MNLLSQVRAVCEGMVVGCWVNGTTLVRFSVGSFSSLPAFSSHTNPRTPDATTPPASPALLLTSNTELIVAPKTRHAPIPSTKSHDLSSPSAPAPTNPAWDLLRRKLVRLLPRELDVGAKEEEGEDSVWVSPGLYRSMTAVLPSLRCTVVHHLRPVNKGLVEGKEKEEKEAGKEEGRRVEVRVREARGVASGQVWVGDKVRKELGLVEGGEGGCELLRCVVRLLGRWEERS